MLGLQRDYFFEFAGMPQGGKTTIVNKLTHYLKKMELPFEEYHGGSKYNSLYNAPIADLNLSLACTAVNFTITALGSEKAEHKIYLMNRGLIDRCIFSDILVCCDKVNKKDAEMIKAFLTLPNLLEKLDGVFIFAVLPYIALKREYGDIPPKPEREVMNERFLSYMYSTIMNVYGNPQYFYIKNTQIISTDWEEEQETFGFVLNNILSTIQSTFNIYNGSDNLTFAKK